LCIIGAIETKGVFFIYDTICIANNIDEINKVAPKNDSDNVSVEDKK